MTVPFGEINGFLFISFPFSNTITDGSCFDQELLSTLNLKEINKFLLLLMTQNSTQVQTYTKIFMLIVS